MSPFLTPLPGLATCTSTSAKSEPPEPPLPAPPPPPPPLAGRRPPAVDPSPLVPVAELVEFAAELPVLDAFCDDPVVCRSPNRFCVPRIAPRLEAGAPGAPAVAARRL